MMNELEEAAWTQGRRSAYERLLSDCLRELGHTDQTRAVIELEAARVQCAGIWRILFPDDPFDHNLHLADVLERIGDEVDNLIPTNNETPPLTD